MWTRLKLRNFKGYSETPILPLRKLTILIGPNGGGKSTLLKFFMTLKQTVESSDTRSAIITSVDEEKAGYVDLGLYKDYVHMGKIDLSILFWLWWDPKTNSLKSDSGNFKNPSDLPVDGIHVVLKRAQKNEVVVQRLSYMSGTDEKELVLLVRREKAAYTANVLNGTENKSLSLGSRDFSPLKFYRFSSEMLKLLTPTEETNLRNYALEFEDRILQTFYLGPLRQNPRRYYLATGETPDDLGLKGQKIGTVLYATTDDGLLEKANFWLRELDIADSLSLSRISRGNLFSLDIKGKNQKYVANISDYGFGVSQILPVIIESLYAPNSSTVLIEQPEIHLNAHHQLKMPDFFAELIKSSDKQFIIETHSEYFLKRLGTLVAEQRLSPNDVIVLYCYADQEGSHVKPIQLDDLGQFDYWPDDFLSEGFEGSVAHLDAIQKRAEGVPHAS